MVEKLTSAEEVVAKVIADLQLRDGEIPISDMITWIGEGLEKIGAVFQYSKEVSGETNDDIIPICDYQAKLPCDIHKLISVAYSNRPDGGWRPTRTSTNTFNRWGKNHSHGRRDSHHNDPQVMLFPLQSDQQIREGKCTDYTMDVTYSIKPGWINFNVRDGFAKLAYTVIPTDDKGYPLVPQIASVMEALQAYVAMKIMRARYIRGEVQQYIYYDIKQEWTNWRKTAYADLQTPNVDELNSITNTWVNEYPNMREHETFYDTTGERQRMYDYTKRFGGYPWNMRTGYGYRY